MVLWRSPPFAYCVTKMQFLLLGLARCHNILEWLFHTLRLINYTLNGFSAVKNHSKSISKWRSMLWNRNKNYNAIYLIKKVSINVLVGIEQSFQDDRRRTSQLMNIDIIRRIRLKHL